MQESARRECRDLTVETEGNALRARATWYSELNDYESPWPALVGPDSTGTWRILEETFEVQR